MTTRRLLAVAVSCLPLAAGATNGYQLIGIGSYQKSLAGAVTAHPGSAMTAITNPAGMARLGTRADFSMEAFMPDRFVDFRATGGARQDSATRLYGIPALGWTAPVGDAHPDVYFGGGIYGTSGLGVDYGEVEMMPGVHWTGYSAIQFWQMAPTLSWRRSERLSLGVSLDIDYQSTSRPHSANPTTPPLPAISASIWRALPAPSASASAWACSTTAATA